MKLKIFCNNNVKSLKVLNKLKEYAKKYGMEIVNNNYDIAIAIGGDGSFLRMTKECDFDENILYVGINTGTLGFAQEIYPDKLEEFFERLSKKDYKIEKVGIQETKVYSDYVETFYSLNEIVIRDEDLKVLKLNIEIDDIKLETFVGDGVLFSTSFGSTAYNLCYGGSIVYNDLSTLQITPIAPLNNKFYKTLFNSVIIPKNRKITLTTDNSIVIMIDGENVIYEHVDKIETKINKIIKLIRMNDYDWTKKINEKFLK